MIREPDTKIVLEDGREFAGCAFGAKRETALEIVFNTSMAGYQEILSDPSYTGQAVVMTYPLIGNYGMAADDYETDVPTVGAMIVREICEEPSNFRCEETLGNVMARYGVVGVSGVDTRALTRSIRDFGTRKALITGIGVPTAEALAKLAAAELPRDQVARVSCPAPREFPCEGAARHVVLIDCGMKRNIVRSLNRRGCRVTAVPWDTDAETIRAMAPDGVVISNGPGDPTDVPQTIAAVRALLGSFPMMGICLGHQIVSLACGARTYKLKFGHRGGNHPVRELASGKIEITSQNHSFAVDADTLAGTGLTVTHVNLLDGTVEGVADADRRVFSVQYHPESAPGPQDSAYLFDRFIRMMEENHA